MDIAQTLLNFSELTGVSGREDEAAAYGRSLLDPFGKVETTPLGSIICRVREPEAGEPHLLWDAHMDEIGMIVTYIEDSGFLRVGPCGGVDRRLLLASLVTVHGEKGPVRGVICSQPPHLTGGQEKKNVKVDEIYIDIGFTKEQAEQQVQPGDRVTIHAPSKALLNGYVSGKAIDDRAGCVALLCGLEALRGQELHCGLTVQFSTMEEVGGQGAATAAYRVAPTHAIAVDVSFGHTPDAPKEKCGVMKKGPMIGYAPILKRQISEELARLAELEGIPFQREVMGGDTSTNADHMATTMGGVETGLVSIPQKYMHTPIETVAVEDVENTGKLLAAFAKSLNAGGGKS